MKGRIKYNLLSGVLAFLFALPLFLKISKASGLPLIVGSMIAIVCGLLGAFLTGSHAKDHDVSKED